ncbi:MAG: hypothetical protein KAY37_09785 [Phycisphaerae bacterium]|nr:hypothetical protein [Phycisphaerae bacterium]
MKRHSIALESHRFTGLFEAELLTRLMLWKWEHPLAADDEFVSHLVEEAAEVLRKCVQENERFLEDVEPCDTNFVAAVWYVECAAISAAPDIDPEGHRQAWLDAVRRALPSCFCDPEDLQ